MHPVVFLSCGAFYCRSGRDGRKGLFFMLARWWDLFGGILEGATRTRVTPLVQEGSHGVTQAAKIKTALV